MGSSVPTSASTSAWWRVLTQRRCGRCFVDLQTDVTVADVALAHREGYRSVEHVKRYTTLGMGTDQGKTGNVNGIELLAALAGEADPGGRHTTTFRPPYAPVRLGALAGHRPGEASAPVRVTPMHEWHESAGAVFMSAGLWRRAQVYPRAGESEADAVSREARNVREAVGITDVSPLGKFELHGRDVATFLERVYANGWRSLAVGRSRYGAMLRPDGVLFDDGTTSRLGDEHYFMTCTTGNAERVLHHLSRCLQVEWPGLDVRVTPVTEQWGAMAIAGPRARELLAALAPDFAIDREAFAHLSAREGHLGDCPVRVFRISFSGELGFEVYAPAGRMAELWQRAMRCGEPLGLMPYGTEAMMVLRIEKGFIVPGFEADGRTTLDDLGIGRMLKRDKACIGQAALHRPAFDASDRLQLVGILCSDPERTMPRGAQLIMPGEGAGRGAPDAVASPAIQGHLTSMAFSPTLNRWIALALVRGGRARSGERLVAAAPILGERADVVIVEPIFVDPKGERAHG